jgi:hypothetical protein
MDVKKPYSLKLTPKRGKGITILGGISNKNKKLIWVTGNASNSETTKNMLV